eukprot:scaffold4308_cov162-Ochromonas_danica.AAC.10
MAIVFSLIIPQIKSAFRHVLPPPTAQQHIPNLSAKMRLMLLHDKYLFTDTSIKYSHRDKATTAPLAHLTYDQVLLEEDYFHSF